MLVALCRPLLDRDMFTEPASTRAIAEELVITQAAVKQHLANLYDKFGVAADGLQPPLEARQRGAAARRGVLTSFAGPRAHRALRVGSRPRRDHLRSARPRPIGIR